MVVKSYGSAALSLETSLPEIVGAYKRKLRTLGSPLVLQREAWLKARHQAESIVHDCVAALKGEHLSSQVEMWRYSRGVAADRVEQGIAISESIRAVEVLWEAMAPTVRSVALSEKSRSRTSVQLLVAAAFRSSASWRLYAGARNYEAAQGRPVEAASRPDELQGSGTDLLSARERQVLAGVGRAMSNAQIAHELGIAPATVKRHLYKIYTKLGAVSRVDAINKARDLFPMPIAPSGGGTVPVTAAPQASEDSPHIASA